MESGLPRPDPCRLNGVTYQFWFRVENGRRTGGFCTSTFTQVVEDDGSPLYMKVDRDPLHMVNESTVPLKARSG